MLIGLFFLWAALVDVLTVPARWLAGEAAFTVLDQLLP